MKNTYLLAAFAVCTMGLASCSEDKLSSESVIVADKVEETPFDKWLKVNIVTPYNIEFKYRYSYNESDKSYYTVPANYEEAIQLVHIVKYTCIEAYDEVAGVTFTRTYFPKLFYLEGEWHYRNNGTIELGTAEGGKKINLMGVNHLAQYMKSTDALNTYYLKTIHHEFTHILNQTRDYSAAYQLITPSYLADQWSVSPNNTGYLTRGFITDYAQYSHTEDFAEMLSEYVTNSAAQWEAWMTMKHWYVKEVDATTKEVTGDEVFYSNDCSYKVGDEFTSNGTTYRVTSIVTSDRAKLESKLTIVRNYMKNTFNIDIDKLREAVLRREADVVAGKIDLDDITIDE